jgi:DNA-binding NarL/FixJ family response regulator
MKSIYILDDHPIITEGIAQLLANNQQYQITTGHHYSELYNYLNDHTPDLLIIDYEIQDKTVYIDSILAHATNLDNELKKYRNWYEQSPRYGERVEELEKINEKCTQLYNETLEKMDALLVENLNFKKKYKVK